MQVYWYVRENIVLLDRDTADTTRSLYNVIRSRVYNNNTCYNVMVGKVREWETDEYIII